MSLMFASRNLTIGCVVGLSAFSAAFTQITPAQTTPAQTTASEASATEAPGSAPQTSLEASQLAQRYVNEKLALWQHRLTLDAWRISVVPARRGELKANTLGGIRWDKNKKTAVIWVLDPADYRMPFRQMLDDMELTIVHELVHLELASLPRSEASRSNEEHAVNGIAEALLNLDRKQ
jgi:hypothetical protein